MKILSIGPMPDNTGFMELLNEDGTLFGFAFEPSKEHREAMKTWFAPAEPVTNHLHWGQSMTYNSPATVKMAQVMLAGMRCE